MLARAKILIEHSDESIEVMFNPEEYTIQHENNFAAQDIPGLSGPVVQFVHGNQRTLQMELLFDTFEFGQDVRTKLDPFLRLLEIDSELHAPPILRISWGSLLFRCVLAKTSQQFIAFLQDGRPARARVDATFNEVIDPGRESRERNRQTADFTKRHIGRPDDTLQRLATEFYDDPSQWRAIALENRIVDAQASLEGLALRIPSLPYRDRETGEVLQ